MRLSSSIGSAILGADVEQRGDGRWVCKGEEGTLRDLVTAEFVREMGLQIVDWSETK